MTYIISPSSAVGKVKAPPSKSMAHRLLICAGLARGESIVKNIALSKDIQATISCLNALGANIRINGTDAIVSGIDKSKTINSPLLNCGESGSTIRFFVPISLLFGNEASLCGAESLLKRPMDIYKDLSETHGFSFSQTEIEIHVSGNLKSGTFTVPGNVSSQFITGLLFALPLLDGDSVINITPPIESYSYLKLTLKALDNFGIKIEEKHNTFYVKGNQKYIPQICSVEGDYSNAAFLDALNYLGGFVDVQGLKEDSLQGDKIYKEYFPLLESSSPTLDISDCPDLGPVLFALAAAKNGAIFTGTKRLKIKESDRVAAMAEELLKVGVKIKDEENKVIIPKSPLKSPKAPICSHNDHRIVMAMTLLLTLVGGEINNAEAVNKSFPDFFDYIKSLGIGVNTLETN